MLRHTLCKVIQRKTYTCLSHKMGIYLAYSGIVIVLYSMFHFGEELLEWSQYQYDVAFSVYHDNIASRSFQHRLCSDVPIDVVYTWVNGSDPLLLSQLNKVKLNMDLNSTERQNATLAQCNFNDCMLLPLLVIRPRIDAAKLSHIIDNYASKVASNFVLNVSKDVLEDVSNVTILRLHTVDQARTLYIETNVTDHLLSLFHVTTDGDAPHSMMLHSALILKSIPNAIKTVSDLEEKLPADLKENMKWLHMSSDNHLAFVWLNDDRIVNDFVDDKSNSSLKSGFKIDDDLVNVHSAYFVGMIDSQGHEDVVSKSRFEDNEELRYSLRSIEKYAPWVHHIYIVTNGQIPYWLNMDSPHITVVTHDDIFVNKSHLPTFSSPAIEAHLHRIPGLADKFIYFNDDVLFGKEVWPDDFYTHTSGQKVYLTWPVPNCAEGCAPSWINDGYCDMACNVSECGYDGNDCTGDNIKAGVGMNSNFGGNPWQSSFMSYCKPGCSNSWLADRFCDQACNVYECGFDAGDCGLRDYDKAVKLTSHLVNGSTYHLPPGKHMAYIELSKTFRKVKLATYKKDGNLRTAAVSNKFHVITIIFNTDGNETEVSFNITGIPFNVTDGNEDKGETGNNETIISLQFKVTAFPSKNETTNITISIDDETDVEVEEDIVPTNVPRDDIPEAIFIDIPEDMKQPRINIDEKSSYVKWPFPIQAVNRTSDLPADVQAKLIEIETDYKHDYLTDIGYNLKMYRLLGPYIDELTKKYAKDSSLLSPMKGDDDMQERTGKMNIKGASDVKDEQNVKENSHSHIKGDPGAVKMEDQRKEKHGSLRKDAPRIDRGKLDQLLNLNRRNGAGFSNQSATFKSRKLTSTETDDMEQASDGFLPWERDKDFKEFMKNIEREDRRREIAQRYETRFRKRKLLDTFGDSLRFVSSLYNKRFGFTQRKVPGHMPHMIDKNIMIELQSKYPDEYDMTSSHKLRHSKDMQFAFSYFYYLMSEEKPLSYSEVFDDLDTDDSGVLSDREIRLFATRVHDLPLTLQELTRIEDAFKTCAWEMYGSHDNLTTNENVTLFAYTQPTNGLAEWAVTENYYDKDMPLVTKELVLNCPFIKECINKTYSTQKKYKFKEVDQDEIAFKMIRDNVSTVVGQLDDIRKNPKKFICLNDNIDHDLEQASTVKAVLRDFYETLFPKQSQFELPYEYRNRFTNFHELRAWKISHDRTLRIMHTILGFLFLCVILSFFWDHIFKFWRRYRYVLKRRTLTKMFNIRSKRSNPV